MPAGATGHDLPQRDEFARGNSAPSERVTLPTDSQRRALERLGVTLEAAE